MRWALAWRTLAVTGLVSGYQYLCAREQFSGVVVPLSALPISLLLDRYLMPMTDKNRTGDPRSADSLQCRAARDEGLAATVSAYLDGELTGEDLVEFETLLRNDDALSREIAEMRRIDRQLTELGAEILDEPIPDALLEALTRLEGN